MTLPTEFILASGSPRRRELLAADGWKFRILSPEVEEHGDGLSPQDLVEINAHLKAEAIASEYPNALVLGSDTTVALGDTILNKPTDMTQAREMLRQLSGKPHRVLTAISLLHKEGNLDLTQTITSKVQFKTLDESTIDDYLTKVHTLDKAGGYAIQEHGELIIENYEEPLSNIIGLPIEDLRQILNNYGFDKIFRS